MSEHSSEVREVVHNIHHFSPPQLIEINAGQNEMTNDPQINEELIRLKKEINSGRNEISELRKGKLNYNLKIEHLKDECSKLTGNNNEQKAHVFKLEAENRSL